MEKKQSHWSKFWKGSGITGLTVLVWEILEELLENVIAIGISAIFSTALLLVATQGIKLGIKKLIKVLSPIIKQYTYKEGNDKMSKVRKFFTWILANKKTLIGTIGALVTSITTAYATYGGYIDFLPTLNIGGFDLTAVVVGLICFVLVELGVTGKGFETIKAFTDRKKAEDAEKAQKAIVKEAQKELKAEQKLANQTQAQKEKDEAKKQAEQKAKAEKEKAEAEHRAKIDQAKAELKNQKNA